MDGKRKKQNFKISNFMKEIKVIGKVDYKEYKEYLSDKTIDETKNLYIELQIKYSRIKKLNTIIGLTSIVYLISCLITYWNKIILKVDYIENMFKINNILTFINLLFVFSMVILFLILIILINFELNYKRKILIIEEIFKESCN